MQKYDENVNAEFIAKGTIDTKEDDVNDLGVQKIVDNPINNDFILNEQKSSVSNRQEDVNPGSINGHSSLQDAGKIISSETSNDVIIRERAKDEIPLPANETPSQPNVGHKSNSTSVGCEEIKLLKYDENINAEFIAKGTTDTKSNNVEDLDMLKVIDSPINNDFILNEQKSNVSKIEEDVNPVSVDENSDLQDAEKNNCSEMLSDITIKERVNDNIPLSTDETSSQPNEEHKSNSTAVDSEENKDPTDETPSQPNEEHKSNSTAVDSEENEEWLDILGSGQLKRKILKRAENTFRPQNSFICEINVEGKLEDGTIVDKFEHRKIQLGDAELVQGLDLTLPLMDVGEECLVEVAPRFAYGALGRAPDIPPNSTIMYKLELLSAEPEPELDKLPIAERKRIGNEKRERGNWWYARQDYTFAIQCYRRALEFLDEVEGGISHLPQEENETLSEELQDLFEDRLKVYNNIAAAQMKIKAYDTALQSVENVLNCQPRNVKALFRKGKILAAKGDNASAVAVLRSASQLEPDNKTIKQELLKLVSLRNEDTRNERNLYKKMLGQEKNASNATKGPSKSYQIRWGILFGSVAAVVAGMVAYRYKFL